MPATYTYNDAIEDAQRELVLAWDAAAEPPETYCKVMLEIIGRLEKLKRPHRRPRVFSNLNQQLTQEG